MYNKNYSLLSLIIEPIEMIDITIAIQKTRILNVSSEFIEIGHSSQIIL